jgi:hypothetical protein
MILTAEEYSRGFIDFDAELPEGCAVNIWTETTDDPAQTSNEWAGPYSTPTGCKVLSPPRPNIRLRIELKRGDDPSKTPVLRRVRWERDGKTFIWPGAQGFNGPPAVQVLGRDYGCSYRLVFRPSKAFWSEPLVLIDQTVRVRFSKGQLEGYEISGFQDETPNPDGTFSVEGSVNEIKAEGDFIEVLATVLADDESTGKELAKTQVESITGLLSLCFGEQILGETVFEDYFFSNVSTEQGEVCIPVKQLAPQAVSVETASVTDTSLTRLYASTISTAISLALRWYAKGLAYKSPVDQFIAYFIGLDALANGYFATLSPAPVNERYKQLQKYLAKAQPPIDHGLRDIVLARVADFPLPLKFDSYWESHFQKETRLGSKFPKLNRLRGELLHGKAKGVTPLEVNDAKTLLEKLLGRELGLDSLIDSRQAGPKIFESVLRYVVQPRERQEK